MTQTSRMSVTLTKLAVDKLDDLAKETRASRSSILRQLVENALFCDDRTLTKLLKTSKSRNAHDYDYQEAEKRRNEMILRNQITEVPEFIGEVELRNKTE